MKKTTDYLINFLMAVPVFLRPSRVLLFLIAAVIGSFAGFVFWQNTFINGDSRLLTPAQWILAIGAFTAMTGWMVSAIVTVRNSVKQHTINTLLQSRLSQAYVERLKILNKRFSPVGQNPVSVTESDFENTESLNLDALDALRYFLNHLEFIALAIKHGDLDEGLMRASMVVIVRTQATVGDLLIKKAKTTNPNSYCNLRWLVSRWETDSRCPAGDKIWFIVLLPLMALASWGATRYTLNSVTTTLPSVAAITTPAPPLCASICVMQPANLHSSSTSTPAATSNQLAGTAVAKPASAASGPKPP